MPPASTNVFEHFPAAVPHIVRETRFKDDSAEAVHLVADQVRLEEHLGALEADRVDRDFVPVGELVVFAQVGLAGSGLELGGVVEGDVS